MKTKMEKVETIDCAGVLGPYESLKNEQLEPFMKEFAASMTGIGFAFLVNHGVNMKLVEEINRKTKLFFNLPQETKNKYRKVSPVEDFHGYSTTGDELANETTKNSTELREFFDVSGPKAFDSSYFPSEIPGLKEDYDALRVECVNLGKKLLRCVGKYLKLDDEEFLIKKHSWMTFSEYKKTHTQFRSLHYYPLNDSLLNDVPQNAIRLGEHTDWGTITLLFQDMVGGLEVKRTNGEWVPATPVKDAVLINTGQLLERWTGGYFPATPHRVLIPEEERLLKGARQSCVFFINPDAEEQISSIVKPLPGNEKYVEFPVKAYEHYQRLISNSATY